MSRQPEQSGWRGLCGGGLMLGAAFSIFAVLVALVVGWVAVAAAGGDPVVHDSDDHGGGQ